MALLGLEPREHQLVLAEVLEARTPTGAPLYAECAVCVPRRASKTTTMWAILLGRCANRPGYMVVTTAQTGVKARARFLEVARAIARRNVGRFRILRGAGAEAIEWTNGSRLWVVPPEDDAFRGDPADVILFDEAQQHTPEESATLLGAALSMMDTRIDLETGDALGQVWVAGTAGSSRAGMLWDYLEAGRNGLGGIVEYAAPDEADPTDEAVWLRTHPGIGTLTTLDIVRARFAKLDLKQFRREYLGQWPVDLSSRAINPADWQATRVEVLPDKPTLVAFGFDVPPSQDTGAIVAAWRDSAGHAWWEVVEQRPGDAWLALSLAKLARAHPAARIGYDSGGGANEAIADRLERELRIGSRLDRMNLRDRCAADAQASQEIRTRNLRHVDDPDLDDAAEAATRRPMGDGAWLWGRRKASSDVSSVVAGSVALRVYDTDKRTRKRKAGPVRLISTQ